MAKINPKEIKIWEGIYKNFKETGVKEDVFNEDIWTANSLKKLKESLWIDDELLSFLASVLLSEKNNLKVIDFGGGIGITYAQLIKSIPHSRNIQYLIVEKKTVYEAGSEFFKKDKKIRFFNSMPKIRKADIVYLRSSLQYIDDWRKTLADLASYKPRFFLFVDLFAGNIPSYVTVQNYYGGKIPTRFFNIKEIKNFMKNKGFEVLFEAPYASAFFGKPGDFPQENFPDKYKLGRSKNILFFNKNNI